SPARQLRRSRPSIGYGKCALAGPFWSSSTQMGNEKRPKAVRGSFVKLGTSESIRYSGLSSGLLDRLVGVARQTGIHLTELRQLGNIGFISHSGVLRLDLDNLLELLLLEQRVESTCAL